MLKRAIIVLALAVTLALPFVLRPHRASPAEADDTLVIITPHNEAIRHEFTLGFADWYRAKTGRTVFLDWRMIGGTSEIARYLEGEYVASFRNYWTGRLGKPWSAEIQSGFQNGRLGGDAPALVMEARAAFLASQAGCGIDLFFGGGPFDYERQARTGRLVDSGIARLHPEWFTEQALPQTLGGEINWDRDGLWYGTVLSSYGILFNRDSLRRLGVDHEPRQWADLTDPRYVGQLGMCDPTKSGAIAAAIENVVQEQMHRRVEALAKGGAGEAATQGAIRQGWVDGLRLLQLVGANARYFTDASQKPPIDVATGDCAAGMCIDFYGRQEAEAVRRRGGSDRLAFVTPAGGTVCSVDPIALLRGAKNREVALAFIDWVLSLDAQKLWNFKPGTPGGPKRYALRRMPIRRDYYAHAEFAPDRSDPDDDPYGTAHPLIYQPA